MNSQPHHFMKTARTALIIPVILGLLVNSRFLACAESACNIAVRLDVLTIATNKTKTGFPPLILDYQNPIIYFQRKIDTNVVISVHYSGMSEGMDPQPQHEDKD